MMNKLKPKAHLAFSSLLFLALTSALGACGESGSDDDGAMESGGSSASSDVADVDTGTDTGEELANFSFFVTSMDAMLELSGSPDGFGGDLGGLEGADAICQSIAAGQGFDAKQWRAFLSVTAGADGQPVNAIDRIGDGPWYDRNGRLVAQDIGGLLSTRPDGDDQAVNDLPNEFGIGQEQFGDNHDIPTGSNQFGELFASDPKTTCQDWTSALGPGSEKEVMGGHSWPAMSGQNWIQAHTLPGCAPGVNLVQNGPGEGDCIGCGGGYGGIYCFATTP